MTEVFEFLLRALKSKFVGTIELNYSPTGDIKISYGKRNLSKDELANTQI